MAEVAIARLQAGIDRTRRHGEEQISRLWRLVNGYVDDAGRVLKRPGFTGTAATTVCRGLYGFRGKLHTFAHAPQANPSPALLVINVLRHPTGGVAALARIHSVHAVLGGLYVVAEFADGVIKHYWLEAPITWTAARHVFLGEFIGPTVPNGFVYEISNGSAITMWQANKSYALASQVQPSVYSGWYFQAILTTGTEPKSGDAEPDWPDGPQGETITEVRLPTRSTTTPTVRPPRDPEAPPLAPVDGPNSVTQDRYPSPRRPGTWISLE